MLPEVQSVVAVLLTEITRNPDHQISRLSFLTGDDNKTYDQEKVSDHRE